MPPSAVFREPLALNADGTMTSMAIEALPRLGTEHNVGDVPVVAWVYALGAMEPRPTTLKVRAPRERLRQRLRERRSDTMRLLRTDTNAALTPECLDAPPHPRLLCPPPTPLRQAKRSPKSGDLAAARTTGLASPKPVLPGAALEADVSVAADPVLFTDHTETHIFPHGFKSRRVMMSSTSNVPAMSWYESSIDAAADGTRIFRVCELSHALADADSTAQRGR